MLVGGLFYFELSLVCVFEFGCTCLFVWVVTMVVGICRLVALVFGTLFVCCGVVALLFALICGSAFVFWFV